VALPLLPLPKDANRIARTTLGHITA
jgi:hypothetical protein